MIDLEMMIRDDAGTAIGYPFAQRGEITFIMEVTTSLGPRVGLCLLVVLLDLLVPTRRHDPVQTVGYSFLW